MNVSLTPALEKLVRKKVTAGHYQTASEVVREALRLLDEYDRARQIRLEALRKEIAIGLEQADRGLTAPLDVEKVKASVRKKLARERRNRR